LNDPEGLPPLRAGELDPDPWVVFREWLSEGEGIGLREPHAVTLATADSSGRPSARMVLVRRMDDAGFQFFTNYDSRKGRELQKNPQASMLYYWDALQRQVRIEGTVEKLTAEESDAYFMARQRGSQISAWTSRQSQVVSSREALQQQWQSTEARLHQQDVSRPPFWGGFRLRPAVFEFWQGQPNRFHDRLQYSRVADGSWFLQRLAP